MEVPSETARALICWHETWTDALAQAGARTFLAHPDEPVTAALLTIAYRDRAARVLVRDGERVETSVDGEGAPVMPNRFDSNEGVLRHVGTLADWVLDAPPLPDE